MTLQDPKAELIAVAERILDGEMPPIEGCRKICSLAYKIGAPDDVVFLPIQAIDSETDHFPLGEMRKHCAPDYLKRIDEEMDTYLAEGREDIREACREIIRVFSAPRNGGPNA